MTEDYEDYYREEKQFIEVLHGENTFPIEHTRRIFHESIAFHKERIGEPSLNRLRDKIFELTQDNLDLKYYLRQARKKNKTIMG